MKKEILMLIIGILIGAIIATGVFLLLQNNDSDNNASSSQSMPSAPSGDMPQMNSDNGTPPEKPDGDENSTEKPSMPNTSTNES